MGDSIKQNYDFDVESIRTTRRDWVGTKQEEENVVDELSNEKNTGMTANVGSRLPRQDGTLDFLCILCLRARICCED